jgi:hypothetical protein
MASYSASSAADRFYIYLLIHFSVSPLYMSLCNHVSSLIAQAHAEYGGDSQLTTIGRSIYEHFKLFYNTSMNLLVIDKTWSLSLLF